MEATKLGYASAMLCNDYWSWDKEVAHLKGKDSHPVSAIHLFMQKHNVDVNTAKQMAKVKTMELAEQYGEAALKCTAGLPMDSPVVRWFALHDLMFAGNALWSMTCPRYHLELPQQRREDVQVEGEGLVKSSCQHFLDMPSNQSTPDSEVSAVFSIDEMSPRPAQHKDCACLLPTLNELELSKKDDESVSSIHNLLGSVLISLGHQ